MGLRADTEANLDYVLAQGHTSRADPESPATEAPANYEQFQAMSRHQKEISLELERQMQRIRATQAEEDAALERLV